VPGVIVTSSEFSVFEANVPTAASIATAYRQYTPRRNRILGQWIGPAPRVTRKSVIGGFETDASWLYAWPDTDYTTQNLVTLKQNLHDQVRDGLQELSSAWSDPAIIPFSEALHGSVNWWASGQAAQTQTREVPATGIARITDAVENPVGPTTNDTHPTTLPQAVGDIFKSPVTWVVIGGVALLVAWPYVKPFLARADRAAA